MPGISGIIRFDNTPVPGDQLHAMAGMSDYRGTEYSYLQEGSAAFLAQNLAGRPAARDHEAGIFHDRKTGVTVAADARLDEPRILARSLAIDDSRNAGSAELLGRAYRRWGRHCLDRFTGDFAIAIWDPRDKTAFCARDPFGVLSLYWAWRNDSLYFASDMQQLLGCPQIGGELDDLAVADLLLTRYQDHEHTVFRNIRRLPQGHTLAATESRRDVSRYWEPAGQRELTYADDEEYAEHFADIFARAVSNRIRDCSDSVGLLMSGGLDSCSLAAQAQHHLRSRGNQLRVRSVVFDRHPECDERQYIVEMERHLGLDIDYLQGEQFPWFHRPWDHPPPLELPHHSWEPFFRHVFSRFGGDNARMVLTGIGGDTLVTGSKLVYLDGLLSGQLSALSALKASAARRHIPLHRMFYRSLVNPLFPAYLKKPVRMLRAVRGNDIPPWISPSFAAKARIRDRLYTAPGPAQYAERGRQAILAEILDPGIELGLRAIDHYASRQGCEVRHPYLDRQLAEFILAIPPQQLLAGGLTKDIVRRAMNDRLPSAVLERPGKTYLTAYMHTNFKRTLREDIIELLNHSRLHEMGFIDVNVLRRIYDDYCHDRVSMNTSALWAVLSLETWFYAYRHFCRPRAETHPVTGDVLLQYNASRY